MLEKLHTELHDESYGWVFGLCTACNLGWDFRGLAASIVSEHMTGNQQEPMQLFPCLT